jgi:hypothetical protein
MELLEKALTLAKYGRDVKQQAFILSNMAFCKWKLGDYITGQTLSNEAQRLAKLCTNLYAEALALEIDAMCCKELGAYKQSVFLLRGGRELLGLCGMSASPFDHRLANTQAEIHFLKSEYVEARLIHLQIAQNTSAGQDPYFHAYSMPML